MRKVRNTHTELQNIYQAKEWNPNNIRFGI